MRQKALVTVYILLLVSLTANAQRARRSRRTNSALQAAAQTMGAEGLKSIQYSGSGYNFALGQSINPLAPWPKFNVKSYTRVINYESASSREELVRTQFDNPPRGGGAQPIIGEQRQVLAVGGSGTFAWNVAGDTATPVPAAAEERALQLWLTPHGFLKSAQSSAARVTSSAVGGHKTYSVSFLCSGKFKVRGTINDQNLVERVETRIPNPVLGDMLVVTTYSDYKDFDGVKFPTRIVQSQGGFPVLDLTISAVKANAPADIQAPDNVRAAAAPPVRVETQKIADGVWYLTGSTHHSAAVELKDYVVVIEGPQNEERSLAVIAEVKKLVPNKPIRYLVNTHHHFDHSGGIRTFAAEGATIITHQINKAFYERASRAPRTLAADKLSQPGKPMAIVAMRDKMALSDGARVLELHHIKGNLHHDGIIMAYLPKEKILIEADVFTPPAPNAPPPATPSPFTVNLYENLQRLKLEVNQIAPLHGRLVTMTDLLKAVGKAG
ncbi:MAG TPA: MBL fold metallo-hydrolase [Blastocatellia bacterium]|nr:MBL fold metallo-hydrolase [Blastocatellia bacterium]